MKKEITSEDCFEELTGQTQSILKVSPVRTEDSGIYKCRVCNRSERKESVDFSDEATVRILLDPYAEFNNPSLPEKPIIHLQPVAPAPKMAIGSCFLLSVVASCKYSLKYKWFKDKREINGATSQKLMIKRLEPEGAQNSWSFACEVSAVSGSTLSEEVLIRLDVATPKTQHIAEDKIALLIGNGAYSFLDHLRCAIDDVATLSIALSSLDFKVISLYNLNLQQMNAVIKWFCELLENGVYAVFYYAGHGYESRKQCYMLPVDAPKQYHIKDTVCANWVHTEIQEHCPALCLMLLDMCRKEADGHPDIHSEVREFYSPKAYPNTYLMYATTASRSAYEVRGERNGIFMKYLRRHITKDEPLKDIFDNVKKEIAADSLAGQQQFPWEEGNLAYECRLTDVIQPIKGVKLQQRIDFFKALNSLPSDSSFTVDENISVTLKFTKYKHCLQNGYCIIVTVSHSANTSSRFGAFVTTANADVTWQKGLKAENHNQDVIKYNEIHNLQKLEESLVIDVMLHDVINPHVPARLLCTLNLGRPSISSLLELYTSQLLNS